MKLSTNLQRFHNRTTHYLWIAGFFLLIAFVIGGLYFATIQVDYVWRWYMLPRYFISQETIEIRAEIEGDVERVSVEDEKATILVKGSDGEESYSVPTEDIRVSEGDLISPGDILATYQEWQPNLFLRGLGVTLQASVYAIAIGIVIGLFGGLARVSSNPMLKWTAVTYVELIRGSPLLVQLFIWYFVLGTLFNKLFAVRGLKPLSPLWYGVVALSLFAGAYVTEIVRAGIQSIHHGQIEASRSLGMSYGQSMRYVILPQAMRRILPPLAGQFISLIKDSSLLGIIAVRELTKATREIVTTSLQSFEMWFTCAALYLVLTFSLSMLTQYMERRLSK